MSAAPPEPVPFEPVRPDAVEAAAGPSWGPIEVVDRTGSTNADLVARCAEQDCVGAVLIAEEQVDGRGRQGRRWESVPGTHLAMSMVVDAHGPAAAGALGWIPLLTGVAVVSAIAEITGVSSQVKWPNDVLVEGLKVSGILAELAHGPQAPEVRRSVVVGVGVNTGLSADALPVPTATSLNLVTGTSVDRSRLAGAILASMARELSRWPHDLGALAEDYRAVCGTLGTRVRVDLPQSRTLVGTASDVDETGRIVITPESGGPAIAVNAGDVTHLRPQG
ncbi:biotin--[acetyl-CoA-carboxylase] ligase [Williamsia herbipolensis]|uniref:biotin--[biotin carboxyl-carrier protein] ligase n=1 Tax=Williamsia herbipolensis TaxID=1603258 RepID=A0AAU4K2A2_9NOCA|nr:biotin--[acetyl-CoA-carboxylase] ligase [Williamsia herbipolensis]